LEVGLSEAEVHDIYFFVFFALALRLKAEMTKKNCLLTFAGEIFKVIE
jgi:hypothetical protein